LKNKSLSLLKTKYGEKILIVDDNKNLLQVLDLLLSAHGYSVVHATDAFSAISMAQKEKPNVIILDIAIPGFGGFMFMERLKSLMPPATIPIIVLTGNVSPKNKERTFKAGAVAFLQKPFDNNELLSAVQKVLRESTNGT
jgi:CheY-like chemotaxis protein